MQSNDSLLAEFGVFNESLENCYITEKDINSSYYGNYKDYIENNYSINGYRALWRAVLLQALIDLKTQSKKQRNQPIKQEAYDWFNKKENEQDVKMVCYLADYNFNVVKELANELSRKFFSK